MWLTAKREPTVPTVKGMLFVEGIGVPGHARAARGQVQRAATGSPTTVSVSTGKHDGTIYNAKLDGAAVCVAADGDAHAHADEYDAAAAANAAANAAADDDGATADDGTNGAIVFNGTAAAIRRAANAAAGPPTALYWFRNVITNGEELMTVRGGQTGSFKQQFTCCREQTVSDSHPKYFPNSSRI